MCVTVTTKCYTIYALNTNSIKTHDSKRYQRQKKKKQRTRGCGTKFYRRFFFKIKADQRYKYSAQIKHRLNRKSTAQIIAVKNIGHGRSFDKQVAAEVVLVYL